MYNKVRKIGKGDVWCLVLQLKRTRRLDVTVSLPSEKSHLSVGKWGYKSNTITVEDGQTVRVASNFINRLIAVAPLFLYFMGGRYLPLIAVLSTIILLFSLPFLKLEIVD